MKLNLRSIYRMSHLQADELMSLLRWPDGNISCPHCASTSLYEWSKSVGRKWKCKECYFQFTVTSGTVFSSLKLHKAELLAMGWMFCAAKKGVSSCEIERLIGCEQKTAFYSLHKFRSSLLERNRNLTLSGVVEIDGAVFGGHRRHQSVTHTGRRFYKKNTREKRTVVVACQRGGPTVVYVGRKESDAVRTLTMRIAKGAVIHADYGRGWNGLKDAFEMMRVNHSKGYKVEDACTNNAESYFGQLRKLHNGTHHTISGDTLLSYAVELAWRRDTAKINQAERFQQLFRLSLQPTEQRLVWSDRLTEATAQTAEIIKVINSEDAGFAPSPRYGAVKNVVPFRRYAS